MEKEYIYEATSVDEALKKGLRDLNLKEEQVKIDVIEGGSAGIFGLFKKNAKVKLIPLDSDYVKKPRTQPKVSAVPAEKAKEASLDNVKADEKLEKVVAVKENEKEEQPTVEENKVKEEKTVKKPKKEDYIVKNKDKIINYLQNIVVAMGYADATVEFKEDGNRHFTLNIKTEENTSLIIGKRGVTLNSLQFLANNYAKKFSSHYFRIEVDCDDYRESRKKTLEELALNLAKKSKKLGKPVELEPMTSVERKIIHNALTGITNVETESRGEEPHRYLVITAK